MNTLKGLGQFEYGINNLFDNVIVITKNKPFTDRPLNLLKLNNILFVYPLTYKLISWIRS